MTIRRRGYVIFNLIMTLCFMCSYTGLQLAQDGNIFWSASYVVKLMGLSILCGTICGTVIVELLLWWERRGKRLAYTKDIEPGNVQRSFGCSFAISFALIFFVWMPVYLAYYPGICSYDITIQSGQFVSHAYNDHHPLAHTLLMEAFYRFGIFLGNANTGIGLYVLFQMTVLTATIAFGIAFAYSKGAKKCWVVLLQIVSMFHPFHWYMSVSATKDTIFTACVLMMLWCFLAAIMEQRDAYRLGKWDIGFGTSTVLMVLFRNNGKFAFLVTLGFLMLTVIFSKKLRKMWCRLFATGVMALGIGMILISALFRVTSAVQGDKREMLSVPIQQLSRTMLYHGGVGVYEEDDNSISVQDKELIDAFLPGEAYLDYRPDISDPVKKQTYTHVFRYRLPEFLKTYMSLLIQYPGDYINAFLAQNAGFLYPFDMSHAYINVNGVDKGLGYVQTRWVDAELNPRGIYKDSKLPRLHSALERFADENGYLNIPLLKYIMMPGFFVWYYVLFAGFLWWKKRYRYLMPLTFMLGYFATCLLGPTVQLRYIYPMMVALPILMLGSSVYGNDE